jgi:hypothetical protein
MLQQHEAASIFSRTILQATAPNWSYFGEALLQFDRRIEVKQHSLSFEPEYYSLSASHPSAQLTGVLRLS